jgi:ATP-dependent protease ClpP protease subunit
MISTAKTQSSPGMDIELSDLLGTKKKKASYSERSLGSIYEFYLTGEITEAEDYIDWFTTIRNASANDVVRIFINSPGGDLFTAIQFMRVLRETQAHIAVSVEGSCMSAATIIFLCGEEFEITPHSLFMIHQYTSGYFGRGNHVRDQVKVESKWSEDLFNDIYEGFLSPTEIRSMIEGQDMWFTHEEAIERLNKRFKVKTEKAKALEEGAAEVPPVEVKKKTSKKKVAETTPTE